MMPEAFTTFHTTTTNNNTRKSEKSPKPVRRVGLARNFSNVNVSNALQTPLKRGNSFVVGQKLRESKWFQHSELKVLCAVVETGFILQKKTNQHEEDPDSPLDEYGVVLWQAGHEKSKNPDHLHIYTLNDEKGKGKVVAQKLEEFWPEGTSLRINNKSDKTETPLEENTIRHQITYSQHSKRKWHNSEHYTYFCRYGPVEQSKRITDHLKWNTGSFFQKIKSLSIK